MAAEKKHIAERLLDWLVRFCEFPPVRAAARALFFNRELFQRDALVNEVTDRVAAHYEDHPLEAKVAARQAKAYQLLHFRRQLRQAKEELAGEETSPQKRQRAAERFSYYTEQHNRLTECEGTEAIIRHLAHYYTDDMAADFITAFLHSFKQVARLILPNFDRAIRITGHSKGSIGRIRELMYNEPVFLLPNHVSNADHIPICLALNYSKLPQPKIAAGANLFRGVSSLILPRVNCYKIRREYIVEGWLQDIKWFQNPIYRRVHREYLRMGWANNEPFLFYPEGTRSRDGKVGAAKMGIISDAFEFIKETGTPAWVVPFSITYTLVPEDEDIEASRTGKNISHKDLFTQLFLLNKAYGEYEGSEIHVHFDEPMELIPEEPDLGKFVEQVMDRIRAGVVSVNTSRLARAILAAKRKESGEKVFDLSAVRPLFLETGSADAKEGDEPVLEEKRMKVALRIFQTKGFIEEMDGEVEGETEGKPEGEGAYRITNEPLIVQYANRIAHIG